MSSAAKIDFENYFALFATSLERFSIPALGSFVWHIERVEVDPKAAQIKPPRCQLKYDPSQRYLTETIAFLMDRYGLSPEEAEAFLKELGNVLVNYLKAANEMDVWKLGKLRRAGVSYRLELYEEAPLSFLEDLHPVSLRHSEGAVAPITVSSQPAAPPPTRKAEKEKAPEESSRARSVEVSPKPSETTTPARRGLAWIGVVFLVLVIIAVGAYFILRKREKASHKPVEIVLGTKQGKSTHGSQTPATSSPSESEKPASRPLTPGSETKKSPMQPSINPSSEVPVQKPPASEPKADKGQATKPSTPSTAPSSPQPALTNPVKGRYYIIVGSYPSLTEAREKARTLGSTTIEFLPGKEGWVRISYYSSSNAADVQARLKEVKARIPDAWVYKP